MRGRPQLQEFFRDHSLDDSRCCGRSGRSEGGYESRGGCNPQRCNRYWLDYLRLSNCGKTPVSPIQHNRDSSIISGIRIGLTTIPHRGIGTHYKIFVRRTFAAYQSNYCLGMVEPEMVEASQDCTYSPCSHPERGVQSPQQSVQMAPTCHVPTSASLPHLVAEIGTFPIVKRRASGRRNARECALSDRPRRSSA